MISAKLLIVAMVMSAIVLDVMAGNKNKKPKKYLIGKCEKGWWNHACAWKRVLGRKKVIGRCRPAGANVNDEYSKAMYKCWNTEYLK